MEFVINQNLVAWSCRGMCGTKLKTVVAWSSVVSCRMLSCRVVSPMCELSFRRFFARKPLANASYAKLGVQEGYLTLATPK